MTAINYEAIQINLHKKIREQGELHRFAENGRMPILDGLTNPTKYQKCPVKIMFILKEAYDKDEAGNIGDGDWDHTEYLNDNGNYDYNIINDIQTHRRVSTITTGILRDMDYEDQRRKELSEIDLLEDFKSVAWINVGKFPAPEGSRSPRGRMKEAYQFWRPLLLEQIELYNPDVIIFGNTFSLFKDDLGPLLEISKSWPTHVYKDGHGRVLLDAYHPQVRAATVSEKDYVNSIIRAVRKNSPKSTDLTQKL